MPFSIDVTREKNAIIVSDFSPYDLTLRGIEVPSKNVKVFLVSERRRFPLPIRVNVKVINGKYYAVIRLFLRSYVIINFPKELIQ